MIGLSRTAQEYRFANGSGACVTRGGETGRAFIFNARIECPLKTGAALIEAQQSEHAFVNFRAVVNATAGKDDSDFLVHGDLLINGLGLDVLAPRVSPNAPQVGICRRGAPQGLG